MSLSQCRLCGADSNDGASLTNVCDDEGKRDNLAELLNQYISPVIFLSKDDVLCVCDTCKGKLQAWDTYINTCKRAQPTLNDTLGKNNQQLEILIANKRELNSVSVGAVRVGIKKKSSNYCIARWCNKGNHQGISLFRLPRERDRSLTWLSAAERTDLQCMTVLHSYYMCASHFTQDMFTNKARKQLIRSAIPTIFPRPQFVDKIASKAVTSQIEPTLFQGAPLNSILPKMTNSFKRPGQIKTVKSMYYPKIVTAENLQSTTDACSLNQPSLWTQKKASANCAPTANMVINVISPELFSPVMNIANCVPPLIMNANRTVSVLQINSGPDVSSSKSESVIVQESYFTSATKSVTQNTQSQHCNNCQTIVGSQDFLLSRISNEADKPSFSLKPHTVNSTTQEEPKGKGRNTTAVHQVQSCNNEAFFDLHTEVDNSSFVNNMENLDELMDLDHYFDGR